MYDWSERNVLLGRMGLCEKECVRSLTLNSKGMDAQRRENRLSRKKRNDRNERFLYTAFEP
jgi:hypothetical protein